LPRQTGPERFPCRNAPVYKWIRRKGARTWMVLKGTTLITPPWELLEAQSTHFVR